MLSDYQFDLILEGRDELSYISPAYGDTFVIIVWDKTKVINSRRLKHIDQESKVLWEQEVSISMSLFKMLKDDEIIIWDVKDKEIVFINLRNYRIRQFSCKHLIEGKGTVGLETFCETNQVCIWVKQETNNILKLFYFNYNDMKPDGVPIAHWKSEDNQCPIGFRVTKIDNQSKIAFWDPTSYKKETSVTFSWVELMGHHCQRHTVITGNHMDAVFDLGQEAVGIRSIWEIRKGRYFIHSNAYNTQAMVFIIEEAEIGSQFPTLIKRCLTQYWSQDSRIIFMNTFCVILSSNKEKDVRVEFVDNETEMIVGHSLHESNKLSFTQVNWAERMVVCVMNTNENERKRLVVRGGQVFGKKELSLHFLLTINEDFDDDLLQDAIELLSQK